MLDREVRSKEKVDQVTQNSSWDFSTAKFVRTNTYDAMHAYTFNKNGSHTFQDECTPMFFLCLYRLFNSIQIQVFYHSLYVHVYACLCLSACAC